MSWRTFLSRTRIEAICARGDQPCASGNFKKSRTRGDTHILLGSLLVFLAVGCNEARVEQPEAKATAEQEKETSRGWRKRALRGLFSDAIRGWLGFSDA